MPEAWLHQVCPFPSTTSLLYKPTKYLHKKYFILNYFVAKKHSPPPKKKITFGNFQNVWASLGTSAGHSQPTIPVLDAIFP